MARYIMELFDTCNGAPAVVVGGGPSTVDDMQSVPEDSFIFGVNTNWVGLCKPDMVVALDANTYPIDCDCPTVGQFAFNDYVPLYGHDLLTSATGFNSAFLATAIAVRMGFDPVYLAGIDCYSGPKPYANSDKTWDEWAENERLEQMHSDNGSRVCADHWARVFRDYPQVIPMSDILRHAWKLQQSA